LISQDKWEWFGSAGHFICSRWCRFHLTTKVGKYLISTLGEYVHPMHSQGSEEKDNQWWRENWPGEDIGYNRKYETMVFIITGQCECGCELPTHDGEEQDFNGYNDAKSAHEGHMKMCEEFAAKC
jgi:hypothetical protein